MAPRGMDRGQVVVRDFVQAMMCRVAKIPTYLRVALDEDVAGRGAVWDTAVAKAAGWGVVADIIATSIVTMRVIPVLCVRLTINARQ